MLEFDRLLEELMSEIEQHDAEWNDRLQDLLDGSVATAERVRFESHVANCARCRAEFSKLKKLDAQLRSKLDAPNLSAQFDQQIYARIKALDAQSSEKARRRIDRELEENRAALSRDWRRALLSMASGAIAGVAVIIALITWSNQTGFTDLVIGAASDEVGIQHSGALRVLVTALIGATIGAMVSRWLTTTID
jgi:anti-sigma factor RsiW